MDGPVAGGAHGFAVRGSRMRGYPGVHALPPEPPPRKAAAPHPVVGCGAAWQGRPEGYRCCRSELSATTMFLSMRSVTLPSTSISSEVSLISFTVP